MALKNDIMFALKEIQKFNRNLIDLNDLITAVAAHLSILQTKNNLDQIKDHLMASTDEDGHIPVDADLMRELLKLVETNINELKKHKSKYKAPKDLEKSTKPTPRKDLKDYEGDETENLVPNSTGEKQKNVLRKTDKPVIDNGSLVPDIKDSDRMYDVSGEKHDPKHSAKVMSKRQDDDEKDSEDSIKDKIENLTREQKERLVREMIRRRIKAVLKEQEEPEEEPAAEEPAPEPEAPAEEPTPAPAPAPAETPEAPTPDPEADAPAEEPAADAAPKQDSTAQLNSFVTLVKNQPTSPEQIKMILKAVQKTGTMTDEQGNEVMNQGKLKELYRYLKIAADRMLEKYS
jgi:hypothetical protein